MKVIKVFIAILILAVVGAAIAGVVVDNLTSAEIEKQIKMIDVPSNTTIDASVSRTGKLSTTAQSFSRAMQTTVLLNLIMQTIHLKVLLFRL